MQIKEMYHIYLCDIHCIIRKIFGNFASKYLPLRKISNLWFFLRQKKLLSNMPLIWH